MNIKPVAEVLLWNEGGSGEYREFRASENLPHGTKLYAIPDTHRVVPVEPTDEMVDYAERMDWSIPDSRAVVINIWQAMLAAAKEKGE